MPLVKFAHIISFQVMKTALFNDFRTIFCLLRLFARTGKNNSFPVKTGLNLF